MYKCTINQLNGLNLLITGEIMELKINESFLIAGLRTFYTFLSINNFRIIELSYNDKNGDYVEFKPYDNKNIGIVLSMGHSGISYTLDLSFFKTSRFFSLPKQAILISDVIKQFPGYKDFKTEITKENVLERMEQYRKFIERHLMPVVKGEKWIDDILKDLK